MSDILWAIVPFIDNWEMTQDAVEDLLAQDIETRVLLINQASSSAERQKAELYASRKEPRVLLWHFEPALPLDAAWNCGLKFVREMGGTQALVCNNDIRVHPAMARMLQAAMLKHSASFVSAVNSGPSATEEPYQTNIDSKGGPDFSCFLITTKLNEEFPFDPQLTYCGDCDLHRRLMLAGRGKEIFSTIVPYYHLASQTIKRADPERAKRYGEIANMHRQYYAKKWGGPVNGERWRIPLEGGAGEDGITNPELQRMEGLP